METTAMTRRNSTSRRVHTLSSGSMRSDDIAPAEIALSPRDWSRADASDMEGVLGSAPEVEPGIRADRLEECPHGPTSWPARAVKSIADEVDQAAVTGHLQDARTGTNQIYPPPQEYPSHGDQIRASDRNARRDAAAVHPRLDPARSHPPPPAQPKGGMGAAPGAGKRADDRRPDLAVVRGRWPQHPHACYLDARRRSPHRRSGGARCRARHEVEHPLHRAVSLYRAVPARRARFRGAEPGQSGLPVGTRDQEGVPRSRHT